MRAIVIGTARERRDLRAALEESAPEIVGEFATLAEARQSGLAEDAVLVLAPRRRTPRTNEEDDLGAETLTPREIEVLELIAEGLPNRTIAERLGISDQTVKFHVASISGKLGAANRTDAVRRGVRRGLVTL